MSAAASLSSLTLERLRRHWAPAVLLVAGFSLGVWSLATPGVVDSAAPPGEFSGARAIDHVAIIASRPHPLGSPANAAVRDYLVAELERLGVAAELQSLTAPDFFGGGASVQAVNVIGRIAGTASSGTIVLMAHYDTVPEAPGANDNSAAVAALLETGRALMASGPVANDIVLLFADGEEPNPRYGSRAFLATNRLSADVRFVVNFETNGGSGPSLLAEISGPQARILDELFDADPMPAAFSFITATSELIGEIGTDFDPFREAGISGLHFAYLRGSPIYHTAADSLDRVSLASLQHHGSHALAIGRHFGNLDLGALAGEGPMVFFTLGPVSFHYSPMWMIAGALAALLMLAAASWRSREEFGTMAIIRAGGWVMLCVVVAAAVGTVGWWVIASTRPAMGVAESYLYLALLIALCSILAATMVRRNGLRLVRFGIITGWVALALATALAAPGFSFLFVWPAIVAVGAVRWNSTGRRPQMARFGLAAIAALALLVPAVDVFWQFVQPRPGNPGSQLFPVAVVPLLLSLLVVGLVVTLWPSAEPLGADDGIELGLHDVAPTVDASDG